jgi:hypothetical protein
VVALSKEGEEVVGTEVGVQSNLRKRNDEDGRGMKRTRNEEGVRKMVVLSV